MSEKGSNVRHLADKKDDSTLWSPRDCLVDFIRQIDESKVKPTKLVVMYVEEIGERVRPNMQCAGFSTAEYIAFLHVQLARALEDWCGE